MLRLHPSELTLTPDDVDETFRRIALGQTSRLQQHWTMPSAGQPGQAGKPNRPILRRGPQRLIRHAMTINNLAMRQPQQAVITLVDQDNDEPHQEATQRDNSRSILPNPSHERNGATVGLSAAFSSHSMQLPLRLRAHVQTLDAQTVSNEQTQGNIPLSPPNHEARPTRPASTRSVENGNEERAQLPAVGSSANTPGLRGGGVVSVARPHNLRHGTLYTPSPFNPIQRLSCGSGGSLASVARASDAAQDTIYAPSPMDPTQRLTSSSQQVSPGDRLQSHSSPSTDYATPNLTKCSAESPYSALEGCGQCDQTKLRRREGGSGATNASGAYSWYGSLGSDKQFPGSENSANDEACPQLDGARARADGLCPLPSLPYTGMQNDCTGSSPPPPCAHARQLSRDHVATTTGVGHDVQRELDGHVEQYQGRQQTRHTLLKFPTQANATLFSVGSLAVDGPNRVQMQRRVYERLQNAAYPTHAGAARDVDMVPSHDRGPRMYPRHGVSNRARNDMAPDSEGFDSGSSVGVDGRRQPSQGQTQDAVHAGPGRRLPRQPRRDNPLSTLASFEPGSDTSRRYWQSPPMRGASTTMTRRHWRVRGEQVDQENAGEEALMRREEANVIARYGEEGQQQRTTMNETPPGIGRVERRMME